MVWRIHDSVQFASSLLLEIFWNRGSSISVGDESVTVSFAQTLTQLRKDVTTLNVSAWNAILRKRQDDTLPNYDEYGQDNGTVVSAVHVDYPVL